MKEWVLTENPGMKEHLISLVSFGFLFLVFYEAENEKQIKLLGSIKLTALITSLLLMYFWHDAHQGFDLYKSDIIIILLGNMAFFGTLIYYFTQKKTYSGSVFYL